MEAELKRDLLREREKTGGKVLLVSRCLFVVESDARLNPSCLQHDEIEENGTFTVTAMWEEVKPEELVLPSLLTPTRTMLT